MGAPKIEFEKNRDVSVLHEKYKVGPEFHIFHLTYSFSPKTNLWSFQGYRCTKCEKLFKKKETLSGHLDSCTILKRKKAYRYNDNVEIASEATVLSKNREVWRPYDSNQN